MKLVRFSLEDETHTGLLIGEDVVDLGFVDPLGIASEASGLSEDEFLESEFDLESLQWVKLSELYDPTQPSSPILAPLVPSEVWGCGITYMRSRQAREVETAAKGIYERVYDAQRPEVFFKATAHRCVGPGEPVYIREDSKWSVPEPELAVVLGLRGRILGYTIGNDMSARDIEGENPLYLPQAKIYRGCCSLGPSLVTPPSIGDPHDLEIKLRIHRNGEVVFDGRTNTNTMKRKIPELIEYVIRDNPVPENSVCLTGTGIVPPDDFSLRDNDFVEISIENIGTLWNPVRQL